MTEFKVPELGENVTTGDVLRVLVNVGDTIKKEQPVIELETDKATIEVPASAGGVVKEVKVKQGEKVKVGQTIFIIEEGQSAESAEPKVESEEPKAQSPEPASESKEQKTEPAKADEEPKPETKPEKRKADVVEMKPSKPAAVP